VQHRRCEVGLAREETPDRLVLAPPVEFGHQTGAAFDDDASYYINIDNTGDGAPDVRYQFAFKTKIGNPNSFLYALPGVSSINDPKLNVKQTYDITRYAYRGKKVTSAKVIARNLAYHGVRAQDASFNITLERDFATELPHIELAPQEMTREDTERRQSLWWYLLLTGVGLLAIETIIANRLSRKEKFL